MQEDYAQTLIPVFNQLIEVGAQVTVTPLVRHGKPTVSYSKSRLCRKRRVRGAGRRRARVCTFTVRQMLSVQIPLTFGVKVDVDRGRLLSCGPPAAGPCRAVVKPLRPPRRYLPVACKHPRPRDGE